MKPAAMAQSSVVTRSMMARSLLNPQTPMLSASKMALHTVTPQNILMPPLRTFDSRPPIRFVSTMQLYDHLVV